MPELGTLLLFAVAAIALLAVPGPSVIYITTRSISEGRRAGLASALGVETGTLVHVAVAAIGLSALLASSSVAYGVVKYGGAAYLIYLGIRALRDVDGPNWAAAAPSSSLMRAYRQALVVQLLNPKVALFFLAFLPQFIDPARGPVAGQIVVLGGILAGLGLVTDSLYALGAGALGSWLRQRPHLFRRQRYLTGCVYLALGATAAFSGERRTR